MTSSGSAQPPRTGDDVVSFGCWKVQKARPGSMPAKGAIVEVQMSRSNILLLDREGKDIGSWPIAIVKVDVYAPTEAALFVGPAADGTEIKSVDGQSALDLREGVKSRTRPPVDRLSVELTKKSSNWTALAVLRQYTNNAQGQAQFGREVEIFGLHGYAPFTQSVDGGHVHVGRLVLTLGWSILAGKSGIRSDGIISVTFQRTTGLPPPIISSEGDGAPSQTPTDVKICPQCAEEVRAAALICRYCRYEFGPLPSSGQPGS